MRILVAVHGFPAELVGGTELATRDLARGLARAGHDVLVFAGALGSTPPQPSRDGVLSSDRDADPATGASVEVRRFARTDLFFDHWQKGDSIAAGRAFERLLADWRPDVVHVQHWLRLTSDLVLRAALAGVPAVVSLHDHHVDCLVGFRVDPRTRGACSAPFAAQGCVACAAHLAPATPWRGARELEHAFDERARVLGRELTLARVRTAPSATHARAVRAHLAQAHPQVGEITPLVPLRATHLARRVPRAEPRTHGALVLGAWGHLVPWKGAELVLAALRASRFSERIELHLAGAVDPGFRAELERAAGGLAVDVHGAFEAEALGTHPVSDVHAMVSGARADESYGFVLDEARALGLPAILPRAGAFVERAREGAGVRFYTRGVERDLAHVFDSLFEPGALADLRTRVESGHASTQSALAAHVALYQVAVAAGAPVRAEIARACEADVSDTEREAASGAWDAALASGMGARETS
ncbi:MAG: glycosyltransferase family 4 protein [bacterium]|nr:glycosyltransferase family 4 protein [bacterium]